MNEPQAERIPFEVEVSRIIEVLATQIYQTPLALLRENTQNAFDAVLMRRHRLGSFDALITVDIAEREIRIADNGIGMTAEDLRQHYWRAGSSGKNTPEARAAGVVGTFGIGAMANFGIASGLTVETESAHSGQRTRTVAHRETLSTTEDCIEIIPLASAAEPGTQVTATLGEERLNVEEAVAYIRAFVAYVPVPVLVNGVLASQGSLQDALRAPADATEIDLGRVDGRLSASARLRISRAGEVWITMTDAQYQGTNVAGTFALRQGHNAIQTFRSGFGLAVTSVTSAYGFGGFVDLAVLQPTAGREALTTESMQLLQETITALDAAVSIAIAETPAADQSTAFMQWAAAHGRYDLCGRLKVRVEPGGHTATLDGLREKSQAAAVLVYSGSDRSLISAAASEEAPLVVAALANPRRQCEMQFLATYCNTESLTDAPTVLQEKQACDWSLEEQALTFRIVSILQADYFLDADLGLGELSHGLPIVALADRRPVRIVIDPASPTFGAMIQLYNTDYVMFGSMVKDYVRNVIFPRVSDLVPSSTRQGAEAFLKSIRRTRDVFEYEATDLGSLTRIWEEYLAGNISMGEAAERSISAAQQSVQVFDSGETRRVNEVVPDVATAASLMGNEDAAGPGPAPPIVRTEVETPAKLLVVDEGEQPIYGHRCFIAISERAREERGDFFLQPHSTSVVWGGQKVLFVFEHHSGEFGLYYDLQASHVVSGESGGGAVATATIVLGNRIFIPVPEAIVGAFVPDEQERKRFEVRCDLLYTDIPSARRSDEGNQDGNR